MGALFGTGHTVRNNYLAYASVFIVALGLRLYGISAQNIWYDEHWTLRVASVPLAELPAILPAEESSKPPLYFAFMHYWLKLGESEVWLRIPSALFGASECLVAIAIGQHLFGPRTGVWLGWLFVVSPFQIHYSQEARPYALWSLFASLTMLFHLKFCATLHRRLLVGYVVFGLLACYTYPYSIFIPCFSVLFCHFYRPALPKQRRVQMALANGIIIVLYLPWLATLLRSFASGLGFLPTDRPVYAEASYALFTLAFGMSAGPSLEKLQRLGAAVLKVPALSAPLIFGSILLGALVYAGARLLWRTNRNALYFALFGLLSFLGIAILLALLSPEIPVNSRYVAASLLPLMVLILAALLSLVRQGGWRWLLPLLFLLAITRSLSNHYFAPQYARDDLRSAADFVRNLQPPPEQVVICAAHLVDIFGYYFKSEIPIAPLNISSGASAHDSLQLLDSRLAGAGRFALIYSRPDHGDPARILPGILQSRYPVTTLRHWTGVDVYVFDKSAGESR